MSTNFFDEIFVRIKLAKNDDERVKILRDNTSTALKQVLYANFSTRIKFLLPESATPFKPNNIASDLSLSSIYKESRKFYLFVQTGNANISQIKREALWVEMLESVSAAEAEVLETVKNKALEQKYGVTIEMVKAAFPDLLKPADLPAVVKPISTLPAAPKKRGRRPKKDVPESF